MKRLLAYLFIVLGLGLTFSVNAEAKTYSSPTEFIEEFNNKSLAIFMKDLDTNQEYKEVSKLIENYFDIKGIGLYSLGDIRKSLNSTQIKKYNDSFKKYWIKSFYKNFFKILDYKIISKKIINKNYTLVTTLGNENIMIDWRVYTKDLNKLQIRDIIIEGYSLARTQKEEFQTILKKNNRDIKELIKQITNFSSTKKELIKVASATKGDLDGFMSALEKAKNAGLTIDADNTAKQFGYKNFEEFFLHYKKDYDLGDLSLEEAKEFLLGSDNTIDIIESQINLDKLHSLIVNDKYFRKRTGYFKKKHKEKLKLLVVYMNYEKEMSKISKDPNHKKIGRFDFRFRWGPSVSGMKYSAMKDCEKSRKKYKLSGGECIIVESRRGENFTNLLKPRLKDKQNKKVVVAQKKIKVKKNASDKDAPVIKIADNFTFDGAEFTIKGNVTDNSSGKIFIKADGNDIDVINGVFSITKFSPVDTEINIIAIDEWGNTSKKLVKININKNTNTTVKKLEPLNPTLIKSKQESNKVALIIGIENYSDIPKVSYANDDAKFFFEYASTALGVSSDNIKMLIDKDATYIEINKILKKWLKSKIKPGKTDLIIFYAGHGLASKDNKELYLLPQDADPDLLSISAISRTKLFKEIETLKPKTTTFFFDACYTGSSRDDELIMADARPVRILDAVNENIPENFTIFSATKLNQIASGLKGVDHGIFSYYLMKGLEGKADANKDKDITNGELIAYLEKNVSQKAAERNREQNPDLIGDPDKVLMSYR